MKTRKVILIIIISPIGYDLLEYFKNKNSKKKSAIQMQIEYRMKLQKEFSEQTID